MNELSLFQLITIAQTTEAIKLIARVHEASPQILYSVGGELCQDYIEALRMALQLQALQRKLDFLNPLLCHELPTL